MKTRFDRRFFFLFSFFCRLWPRKIGSGDSMPGVRQVTVQFVTLWVTLGRFLKFGQSVFSSVKWSSNSISLTGEAPIMDGIREVPGVAR